MQRVAVLNIVGLSASLLPHAPRLAALGAVTPLKPVLPAVTCSVQASMLTGQSVEDDGRGPGHGIIGNGWFHEDLQEIHFWKQSNKLVIGEKIWETARRRNPEFTCANLFWWFNMYSSADISVTPRPIYKADGRKMPDCYTHPASLRDALQNELGQFPLFKFWGPGANIESSRWIAEAAKRVEKQFEPTLSLIYLPHLDYPLQKLGPDDPAIPDHVRQIDDLAGELIEYFESRDVRVIALSEYGIEPADTPIAINRWLRKRGLLTVRTEDGLEMLDPGASQAFAVADHQIAHIYTDHDIDFSELEGIDAVHRIHHRRAGRYCLEAKPGAWFTYDFWLNEDLAPDYARTVDIHRKPGYDPRELFVDPRFALPKVAIAHRLARRKLGQRTLLDVIPLDARLVKGTHGRTQNQPDRQPVLLGHRPDATTPSAPMSCLNVKDVLLSKIFDE